MVKSVKVLVNTDRVHDSENLARYPCSSLDRFVAVELSVNRALLTSWPLNYISVWARHRLGCTNMVLPMVLLQRLRWVVIASGDMDAGVASGILWWHRRQVSNVFMTISSRAFLSTI